jgi:hypothetical protein
MSAERKQHIPTLDVFDSYDFGVTLNHLISNYPSVFDTAYAKNKRYLLLLKKIQSNYQHNKQLRPINFWAQLITFFHHEFLSAQKTSKNYLHKYKRLQQLLATIPDKKLVNIIQHFSEDSRYQLIRPQIDRKYRLIHPEFYRTSDIFLTINKITSRINNFWFKKKTTQNNEKNLKVLKNFYTASLESAPPSDRKEMLPAASVLETTAPTLSPPNNAIDQVMQPVHQNLKHQLMELHIALANTTDPENRKEISHLIETMSGFLTGDQRLFLEVYPTLIPALQAFHQLQRGWLPSTRKIAKEIYTKLNNALQQNYSAGECFLIFTKELFKNYYEYNRFLKKDVDAMLLQMVSVIQKKPGFFEFKHLANLCTHIPSKHHIFQKWLLEKLYSDSETYCPIEDKLYFLRQLHKLEVRHNKANSYLTQELQNLLNCSHLFTEQQHKQDLSGFIDQRNKFFERVSAHQVKKTQVPQNSIQLIDPDNPPALINPDSGKNEEQALTSVVNHLNTLMTEKVVQILLQKGITLEENFNLKNPEAAEQIIQKYKSFLNQDDEDIFKQMLSEYKFKNAFIQNRKALLSQPALSYFYNLFVITYISKSETSKLSTFGELKLKATGLNKKIGIAGTVLTSAVPVISGVFGGVARAAQAIEEKYQEDKHALFADIMLNGSGLEYFSQILSLKIIQLTKEKILESDKTTLKGQVHELTEHIRNMFGTGLISIEKLVATKDPDNLWTDEELYDYLTDEIIQKINSPLPQSVFSSVASSSIKKSQESVKALISRSDSVESIIKGLGSSHSTENTLSMQRSSSLIPKNLKSKTIEVKDEFSQKNDLLTQNNIVQRVKTIESQLGIQSPHHPSFKPSEYYTIQIPAESIYYKMTPQQVKDIFMSSYLDIKKPETPFFERQNNNIIPKRSSQEMIPTEICITASYLQFLTQQIPQCKKTNSANLYSWDKEIGAYKELSFTQDQIQANIEEYRQKLLWDCRKLYQPNTRPREIEDMLDFAAQQSPAAHTEASYFGKCT